MKTILKISVFTKILFISAIWHTELVKCYLREQVLYLRRFVVIIQSNHRRVYISNM